MFSRTSVSTFPFFAAATVASFAAETSPPSQANEAVELSLVRVTAEPAQQPLVTTLDAKAAAQPIPAHDGADYLKSIPGFSVIRKAGVDGDPVFRGQGGSRLAILLDGQAIFGGCGNRMDPPTAYVFPSSYDQITVIKGPQSVRYAPGATAGVVMFDRLPERFEQAGIKAEGSLTLGSFQRHDETAEVTAGIPEGYVRASGSRSQSGDYADGDGRRVHSRYRRWSSQTTAAWTPGQSTSVELSAGLSDGEAAYADRSMDGTKFARENVGLRLRSRAITPLISSVDASLFYNYADHVMDNFSLRPTPAMRMLSNPDRLTFGGRAEATLALSPDLTAVVGADYQENRHRLRTSLSAPRARDAAFDVAGLFVEGTWRLSPKSRVVAGARADRWHAEDRRTAFKITSGMTTMTLANPTAGQSRSSTLAGGFGRYERDLEALPLTVYAGLGASQRFPDYWELFNKETAASLSAFRIKPETLRQLDAGAIFKRETFSASVSLFANDVSDYILIQKNVVKPFGSMASRLVTVSRNVDASSWGGEASAAWDFAPGWKAEGSLAYVRGENNTDNRPLAQQPPLEGRLSLRYATPVWSAGVLLRAVGAQNRVAVNQGNIVGQDIGPSSGFGVFSLNAGWRVAKFAQLSAGVDNVFDRTYAEFISRAGADVAGFVTTTRVNEPGRTIWAKLTLSY
ncbi:TonB-dependent copper receptor [Opitutaceae bacterium EW11]|nr:TonB-dependent copper receptor [Opitutaceae bacterium EW11]